MNAPIVIKIGGHEVDDPAFLAGMAQTIRALDVPAIVVHGGGKEITVMQEKMGVEARYVDGLRITDADSLAIVEMVLCGTVNKRIVRALVAAGVDALGLCGSDRGLIRAEPMQHPQVDMGFTGTVKSVDGAMLRDFLRGGITPVIAPLCLGDDCSLNCNADHVAGAVAGAVGVSRAVFVTNVEGVLVNGVVVPSLTAAQAEALIADGTIFGGMIPKVRTALHALHDGVPETIITNLHGLRGQGGTRFSR